MTELRETTHGSLILAPGVQGLTPQSLAIVYGPMVMNNVMAARVHGPGYSPHGREELRDRQKMIEIERQRKKEKGGPEGDRWRNRDETEIENMLALEDFPLSSLTPSRPAYRMVPPPSRVPFFPWLVLSRKTPRTCPGCVSLIF